MSRENEMISTKNVTGPHIRRLRLKCDGTCAEIRFRLSLKRTSPFKSLGASFHSTAGSRCVRISGSNAGYTMFRGSVKTTGYPLHSPVSPSLPLPCVTACRHISTELYRLGQEPNERLANGRRPKGGDVPWFIQPFLCKKRFVGL